METLSHRGIKGSLAQCLVSRHMSIFDVCSPTFTTACSLRIPDGEQDGYIEASGYSEQQNKKATMLKRSGMHRSMLFRHTLKAMQIEITSSHHAVKPLLHLTETASTSTRCIRSQIIIVETKAVSQKTAA